MSAGRSPPLAEIIAAGDELLRGDGFDTNSREIQALLLDAGVRTRRSIVVGDAISEIADVMRAAAKRADVIIVTGGLGPTEDDVTREAAAAAAGTELEERTDALASIETYFARIRRPMREGNRRQALVPRGAAVIFNPVGTAPGFTMPLGASRLFCLPGVPREMRSMMEESVLPRLRDLLAGAPRPARRKIHLAGVPESSANSRIRDVMRGKDPMTGMTAHDMVVTVTLTSFAPEAERVVDEAAARVRAEFGDRVIGEGEGVTLQGAVAGLLIDRNITLATAESCTGGLVGFLLTSVPGVSAVYRQGFVTYAGEAKVRALGVDPGILEQHGEVSVETARAMAEGAAARAGCRASIAITGIAGPGGGTDDKPVGLVCVAARLDGKTAFRELRFGGDREMVRKRSAMAALDLLRRLILGVEDGMPAPGCGPRD